MSAMRLVGTSISLASRVWLIPMGTRNSSSRISPGGMGSSIFIFAHSLIVHDLDRLGAVVPSETDAPLVVDPDAVLARAVALQRLQPVARRTPQNILSNRICHALSIRQLELDAAVPGVG